MRLYPFLFQRCAAACSCFFFWDFFFFFPFGFVSIDRMAFLCTFCCARVVCVVLSHVVVQQDVPVQKFFLLFFVAKLGFNQQMGCTGSKGEISYEDIQIDHVVGS